MGRRWVYALNIGTWFYSTEQIVNGGTQMKVEINRARCKECGLCIHNCPKKCISKSTELNDAGYYPVQIDDEACIGCGICYTVCPDGVFHVLG